MWFLFFLPKALFFVSSEDMRPLLGMGELQPRPKTTAMVARRFVCNALGVRVCVSKEQKEKEERDLLEAKVAVRGSRKQRQKEMKENEGEEEKEKDREGEEEKEKDRDEEEREGLEGRSTEIEQKVEKFGHVGQEGKEEQEMTMSAGGVLVQSKVISESRAPAAKEVGGENGAQNVPPCAKNSILQVQNTRRLWL